MDNNNKIITEELKQIVVLMNYDRSKTLIEQMGHKPFMGPNPAFYRNNSDGFVRDTQKWHDDNVAMMDNLIGDLDAHDILMAIDKGVGDGINRERLKFKQQLKNANDLATGSLTEGMWDHAGEVSVIELDGEGMWDHMG